MRGRSRTINSLASQNDLNDVRVYSLIYIDIDIHPLYECLVPVEFPRVDLEVDLGRWKRARETLEPWSARARK